LLIELGAVQGTDTILLHFVSFESTTYFGRRTKSYSSKVSYGAPVVRTKDEYFFVNLDLKRSSFS